MRISDNTIINGMRSARMRSVLIVFFLLISILVAFVAQKIESIAIGGFICVVYVFANIKYLKIGNDLKLILSVISILCIPSFIIMNNGYSSIFYYSSTIFTFFAARQISKCSIEELFIAFRLIFIVAVISIFYILIYYRDSPEPFGAIIEGASTNGIPSYLIVFQITFSLVTYLARGRLPLISPLITLMVAFFGIGRGSLIIAGAIVAASLFFNLFLKKNNAGIKRVLLRLLFILITFAIIIYSEEIQLLFNDHTKLKEGLIDMYRMEILDQYLSKINIVTLLFGADYSGTVIASEYDGNPHISYIRTHAYFGLLGLVLVFSSPLYIIFSKKCVIDKLIFLCFVILLLLRALSEPILFPTLLDIFYFIILFSFHRYSLSKKSKAMQFDHHLQ